MDKPDATPTVDPTATTAPAAEAAPAWTPPASAEDLNKIVNERLAKERAKYADYNDLKSKAAKLAELETAQLSEAEKAAKVTADAIARADAAEQALADARRNAVIAAAAKDAHDPAEVARLLDVPADADADAITAAVQELLTAKPYLVKAAPRGTQSPGTAAQPDGAAAGLLTLDEIGRLDPKQVARDPELMKRLIASRDHWAKYGS